MKVNNGMQLFSVRLAGGENNLLPQIFAMQTYFEPCWINPCLLFAECVFISKFLVWMFKTKVVQLNSQACDRELYYL